MSCVRYIDAIVDHACGAEIATDAARHLAACAACRARFEEQRLVLEGLDDELRLALEIVPSDTFARRVHARIEHALARRARLLWWSACGATAAILMVIGINVLRPTDVVRSGPLGSTPQPAPTAASSGPTVPVAPSLVGGRQSVRGPDRPVAHRVRRGPTGEPQVAAMPVAEVLVPPDQQRAIAHLMRLVRNGTLDASRLPVSREGESVTPAELVVPALTIEPIAVPSVEIPIGQVPAGRNLQ